MSIRERIAERLFGDVIRQRVQAAVKVIDDSWWREISADPAGQDQPWRSAHEELKSALTHWRTNPLAFRIVALTTDFVVGPGLAVRSRVPWVDELIGRFWAHRLNRMPLRLERWCDELTRAGELFLVLSTNPADGMSYVREVPATRIDRIDTSDDDLERELRYHELTGDLDGRWWPGPGSPDALTSPHLMLHYAINRPVGALRGRGDLAPIIPWLARYRDWLEDRVRVNRFKSAFLWRVTIKGAGPALLARKQAQYMRAPTSGQVIVTDETEEWAAINPAIQAGDASADGRAIRLMVAAGAGVPLHFLAESESTNRATAYEMGVPTYRHYAHRRQELGEMLLDLCSWVARRARARGRGDLAADLGLYWETAGGDDPLAQPALPGRAAS